MNLIQTTSEQIDQLVKISKEAFDNDITVGAKEPGGPPAYDSIAWHKQMMKDGHLYTAIVNDMIVGGAVVFVKADDLKKLYIGRIFISPDFHRKGYGIELMNCLEKYFSDCAGIYLDTPVWNVRTNAFYQKLGYEEVKRDNECVFYRKLIK